MEYDEKWFEQFERRPGKRKAKGKKEPSISFSWEKFDHRQGQSKTDWESDGLLSVLCDMMQSIGGYGASQVLAERMIKQYTKVGFPPNSNFTEPTHITPAYWAVMHIKPSSKEVVVGYVENYVFYIVYLDKHHEFWPTKDIQDRGKTKR